MNLLPCPFCGGSRFENLSDPSGPVMCIDCGCRGPTNPHAHRVLTPEDAWNTRDGATDPCSYAGCTLDAECTINGEAYCAHHALGRLQFDALTR